MFGPLGQTIISILFFMHSSVVSKLVGDFTAPFCMANLTQETQEYEWWKKYAIYQIYPRSFKDSTGDGTGDLRGILEKIPYLQWLGIRIVWLSPVYRSPMKDFGYDISDYRDVDPIFGTLADLEELISELHNKGMYLIMDLVPNHTSDQHDWFLKSVKKEEPYTDYYVWHDGKKVTGNADGQEKLEPPNNWSSCFLGSAWTWSPEREQYYLRLFLKEQPDLNFRNELVRKEMEKVIKFWINLGVDGFRIDATRHLMEDADFRDNFFPEKPNSMKLPPAPEAEEINYCSADIKLEDGSKIYDKDQPETYDLILEWVEFVRQYGLSKGKHIAMMTESYSSMEEIINYYKTGVDFPFNFNLCSNWKKEKSTVSSLQKWINGWLGAIRASDWPNWVLGNHDQHRLASKLGSPAFVDVAHMLLLLLPGTAICYNGDELAISNVKVTFEQRQDPFGKSHGEKLYEKFSRDPGRSPMPWTSGKRNAGFTNSSNGPWLPLNEDWKKRNVEDQQADISSPLNFFKKLLELRQTESTLQPGHNIEWLKSGSEKVLVFQRYSITSSEEKLLVLMNIDFKSRGDEKTMVKLSDDFGTVVLRTENFTPNTLYEAGSQVKLNFVLSPGQGLVIKHVNDIDQVDPKN